VRRTGITSGSADVVVFAPFAGPLYDDGVAGGAELQAVLIARSLARGGLRVRHLVVSADLTVTADGVEIVQLPPAYRHGGLAGRRALLRGLREADGGVYIQRSASIDTAFVAAFARVVGRRSVFSASSDGDFLTRRADLAVIGSGLDDMRVRLLYRFGLRTVDAVVAQTRRQAELARGLRLQPVLIPNICEPGARRSEAPEFVLWIGSLTPVKDPLAYVDLAERVPGVRFVMVAHEHPTRSRGLADFVHARAGRLPNLELLSRRPPAELAELYGRALAVVNTSSFEGFPNTFLEGWARGVPAVSLAIDPDGVIARRGLGVFAGGSLETAAAAIRRYVEEPETARAAGEAGYRYVEETHAPDVVTPGWLALVERLLPVRVL